MQQAANEAQNTNKVAGQDETLKFNYSGVISTFLQVELAIEIRVPGLQLPRAGLIDQRMSSV